MLGYRMGVALPQWQVVLETCLAAGPLSLSSLDWCCPCCSYGFSPRLEPKVTTSSQTVICLIHRKQGEENRTET